MKIKLEAQLRYDRMAKNKTKGKLQGNQNSGSGVKISKKWSDLILKDLIIL